MADNADRAGDVQAVIEEKLLRGFQKIARRVVPGSDCLACGEVIDARRREALPGCCLCIDCQEDAERAMGR